MNCIQSNKHIVYNKNIGKFVLSANSNKTIILDEGVDTMDNDHYKLKKKLEFI